MFTKIWNNRISGFPMLLIQLVTIFLQRMNDWISNFLWRGNLRSVGKMTQIQSKVGIRYPHNVSLGDAVSVGRNVYFESEYADSVCTLGPGTQINRGVKLDFTGGLTIGRQVLISENVTIYTHSHGADPRSEPKKIPLIIESNVWIGGHAIIIEGVRKIGRGSMVAAGAVVTKEVPAGVIVGGVPAQVIGQRQIVKLK